MDIEAPEWSQWEEAFMALAESAEKVPITGSIKGSRHFLCFYGDNAMSPAEELAELTRMAELRHDLKKVEVDTAYWQDVVLFVP